MSPAVGGVLVRGEKGTAKSTIVRALAGAAARASPWSRAAGSPATPRRPTPSAPTARTTGRRPRRDVRPARLVELPVGASEDRLVGSLDLERALTEGVTAFQPGLLAAAHRGVLYVDEVNLLHDHLVDLLLDAAAMGQSYVEREGVSVRHAARFLLVGTMNPEEGELRPQLLDRFGLTVEVAATRDPAERAEVVRRRLAYEADPARLRRGLVRADAELACAHRPGARARCPSVVLADAALRQIAAVCAAFEVDGLRADLVMARAAVALAAWHGRDAVTADDVRAAARLALPHRRRRDPFDAPGLDEDLLDEILDAHRRLRHRDDARPSDGRRPGQRTPAARRPPRTADGGTTEDPDADPDGPGSATPADDGEPAPGEGALVDTARRCPARGDASAGESDPPAGAAYRRACSRPGHRRGRARPPVARRAPPYGRRSAPGRRQPQRCT